MTSISTRLLAAALALGALAGCGHPLKGPDVGELDVAITQAPSDASCITVTVVGANRTSTRLQQAVAPGTTTTFNFTGLPTGEVVVSASAQANSCAVSGVATWISDPLTTTITGGSTANITLTLHRNGSANVTLDFLDDIKTVTTVAGTAGQAGSTDGTGAAARFSLPAMNWSDGAGNIWIADSGNFTIRKLVIATGAVTTVAGTVGVSGNLDGTGTAARFQVPIGITGDFAAPPNLYVADDCAIRKIATSNFAVTTLAGSSTCASPAADGTGAAAKFTQAYGIATDGTNLYVTDINDCTLRQVVIANGAVTTLAGAHGNCSTTADAVGGSARFTAPRGIAVLGGFGYVADGSVIRQVNLSNCCAVGSTSTIAGITGQTGNRDGAASQALFSLTTGLAFDGANNLWIGDGNVVRKYSNGVVLTPAGTGAAGSADGSGPTATFRTVFGLAFDNTQGAQIFAVDNGNVTIRKLQ